MKVCKKELSSIIIELFDEVTLQQKGSFECGYRRALVDINKHFDLNLDLNWDFLVGGE